MSLIHNLGYTFHRGEDPSCAGLVRLGFNKFLARYQVCETAAAVFGIYPFIA